MESLTDRSALELAQALRDWHDFYVLGGTASATLIGLMFVAVSVRVSYFEEKNAAGLRLFLTPTAAYVVAAAAAFGLLEHREAALDLLAVGLGWLLLMGIRNAWDMTVWVALRTPNK